MWSIQHLKGCFFFGEKHKTLVCLEGNTTVNLSLTFHNESDSTVFSVVAERPTSTHRTGHFQGVFPTWQQSGSSMLTACWKASSCYSIHFRFVLLSSSSSFICPSLCSAAASEVSHTESSIIGPSSSVWEWECQRGREVEKKSTHGW